MAENELRIDVARSRHIILVERSLSASPFGICTGSCCPQSGNPCDFQRFVPRLGPLTRGQLSPARCCTSAPSAAPCRTLAIGATSASGSHPTRQMRRAHLVSPSAGCCPRGRLAAHDSAAGWSAPTPWAARSADSGAALARWEVPPMPQPQAVPVWRARAGSTLSAPGPAAADSRAGRGRSSGLSRSLWARCVAESAE